MSGIPSEVTNTTADESTSEVWISAAKNHKYFSLRVCFRSSETGERGIASVRLHGSTTNLHLAEATSVFSLFLALSRYSVLANKLVSIGSGDTSHSVRQHTLGLSSILPNTSADTTNPNGATGLKTISV